MRASQRGASSEASAAPSTGDDEPAAQLGELLQRVARGEVSVAQAQAALAAAGFTPKLDAAQLDLARASRCGLSEAVFGGGKTAAELEDIVGAFLDRTGQALVTRLDATKADVLRRRWPQGEWHERAGVWTCRLSQACAEPEPSDGEFVVPECAPVGAARAGYDVAVVCAGTSDLAVAEEAAVVLEFSGASVCRFRDVGIAGLQRLANQLEEIRAAQVVITAAGMDGALPTVLAGLVRSPVIALPTSVGYGSSFDGLAALLTMLNACAAGIAVVNIDNGYGAAAMALKILAVGNQGMARSSSIASP